MYKMSFVFAKKESMKYISHLDLMRLFIRAFRRAGLPLKMTEGFSPHPKFSIARALKLGIESDHEEAAIILKSLVEPAEFQAALKAQLPEGIEIKTTNLLFVP